MSCIDAAIIKALVEHIGMDPDDVGSSHGDTKLNVSFGTTEQDGNTYITITENDTNQPIRGGDMFIAKHIDTSELSYYYCIERANFIKHNARFIDFVGERNFTVNGSTITADLSAKYFEPIGVYRGNSLELLSNALRLLTSFVGQQYT